MINNVKSIALCYNEPASIYQNYYGKEHSEITIDHSESEFFKGIEFIQKILLNKFESVEVIPFNNSALNNINKLNDFTPDIIYNFVEAIEGDANYESYVSGLYDLLGYSYTGNSPIALGNCLDKVRTKQILNFHKIPTPNYVVGSFKKLFKHNNFPLSFPVITKLIKEDASIGISEDSVVFDIASLNSRLEFLFDNFNQNVLIEEYIDGREINVSVLGDEVLPISEILFNGLPNEYPQIITYEAKWSPETIYYKHTTPQCPADLIPKLKEKIQSTALDSFRAMNCRDYARVDFRISKKNIPYVIEVNPNPDISIDSGFVRSANAAGINYENLILKLGKFAYERFEYD